MTTKESIYNIDKRVVVSDNEEKEIKMKDKIKKFYKDHKSEIKAATIVALMACSYYTFGKIIGYNKGLDDGYNNGYDDGYVKGRLDMYEKIFDDVTKEMGKEIIDASKSASIVD